MLDEESLSMAHAPPARQPDIWRNPENCAGCGKVAIPVPTAPRSAQGKIVKPTAMSAARATYGQLHVQVSIWSIGGIVVAAIIAFIILRKPHGRRLLVRAAGELVAVMAWAFAVLIAIWPPQPGSQSWPMLAVLALITAALLIAVFAKVSREAAAEEQIPKRVKGAVHEALDERENHMLARFESMLKGRSYSVLALAAVKLADEINVFLAQLEARISGRIFREVGPKPGSGEEHKLIAIMREEKQKAVDAFNRDLLPDSRDIIRQSEGVPFVTVPEVPSTLRENGAATTDDIHYIYSVLDNLQHQIVHANVTDE